EDNYISYTAGVAAHWTYKARRETGQNFDSDHLKLTSDPREDFNLLQQSLKDWIFVFSLETEKIGQNVYRPLRMNKSSRPSDFASARRVDRLNKDYDHAEYFTAEYDSITGEFSVSQKRPLGENEQLKTGMVLEVSSRPNSLLLSLKNKDKKFSYISNTKKPRTRLLLDNLTKEKMAKSVKDGKAKLKNAGFDIERKDQLFLSFLCNLYGLKNIEELCAALSSRDIISVEELEKYKKGKELLEGKGLYFVKGGAALERVNAILKEFSMGSIKELLIALGKDEKEKGKITIKKVSEALFRNKPEITVSPVTIGTQRSAYHLMITVVDRQGVLAEVAGILKKLEINIREVNSRTLKKTKPLKAKIDLWIEVKDFAQIGKAIEELQLKLEAITSLSSQASHNWRREKIIILAPDKIGLTSDITAAIASLGVNIRSMNSPSIENDIASYEFIVDIPPVITNEEFISAIQSIKDIIVEIAKPKTPLEQKLPSKSPMKSVKIDDLTPSEAIFSLPDEKTFTKEFVATHMNWLSGGLKDKLVDIIDKADSQESIWGSFKGIEKDIKKEWYAKRSEYLRGGRSITDEIAHLFLKLFQLETYLLRPAKDNADIYAGLGYQPSPAEFMSPARAVKQLNKIMEEYSKEGIVASIALLVDGRLNLAATNTLDTESDIRRRMDIMRNTHFAVWASSETNTIRIDLPRYILYYFSEKHFFSANNKGSEEYAKYRNLRDVMHDYLIELARRLIDGGLSPEMKFVAYDDLNKSLFEDFGERHPDTLGEVARIKEIAEKDTANLGSINSYDAKSHEDLREYLKAANQIQIYGEKIEGIEFSEEYAAILKDLVEGLPEDIKIILVEHNRGSPDSAEKRMLFYEEKPMRWIFSHVGTRKDTGKFIYLPKTAFLELSKTESGKIFLKKLILEEMHHIDQKLSGDWAEDYHGYEDNKLRQFIIDYLGDRLSPIEIRTPIHILDDINSAIGKLGAIIKDIDFILSKIRALKPEEKKAFDPNDPHVLEIVNLLKNLEDNLKGSRRAEKRRALKVISYIKKDLASGNIRNTLSKLGSTKNGARALLNSYLKVLFEKKNRFENELRRRKVFRLTAEVEFDAYKPHDKETEAILTQEFDSWSNSEEAKNVELYERIVKFYEIWYSRGERGPPETALISALIKDENIKELIKNIKDGSKDFDNLSAYKRQEEVEAIIKKENMNVRDQRLFRAITFTPKFYWAARVPVSARKYISMLISSGMFGAGILYAKGVLNVDYTGDGSEDDWFMKLSAEELSENRYDRSPGPGVLFTSLSNFSGETKKYFRELWKAGKKGRLYEMYNSYQQTSILRDYIWDRDKQVYLIKWKDVSGIEEKGKWVLVKDILRNRPVAFIHSPDDGLIEPLKDLLKAQGSARINI
ncbi:MAG: ACT domain-containing protein, partial [Candidatus Omnitrophica bacterium]|nr:ACT domain-containing protein [Candidatus Omnitrophota bacterium]